MLRNIAYYSTRTAYYSIIVCQNLLKMNKSPSPSVVKARFSNFLKPDATTIMYPLVWCKPRLSYFRQYIKILIYPWVWCKKMSKFTYYSENQKIMLTYFVNPYNLSCSCHVEVRLQPSHREWRWLLFSILTMNDALVLGARLISASLLFDDLTGLSYPSTFWY